MERRNIHNKDKLPVAHKFKKFITIGLRKSWNVNLTKSYHINGLEKNVKKILKKIKKLKQISNI